MHGLKIREAVLHVKEMVCIYAIAIEDEIIIKGVQPVFPDKLLVISDNKQYPTFELSKAEVRVNGKVIWFAREMER